MASEPETFLLIRSARRTLGLEVRPDGDLVVRASHLVPEEQIHRFLARHEAWISRKRAEALSRPRPVPRSFTDGEEFLLLGRTVILRLTDRRRPLVCGDNDNIMLAASEQKNARRLVVRWYRQKAREVFTDRVRHYAGVMKLEPTRIRITSPRRRWGSCGAGGSINLNWKLVMAPLEIIDYIVIHELAHLKIRGHGPDFRELVRQYTPDYRQHEKWLRENAYKLEIGY